MALSPTKIIRLNADGLDQLRKVAAFHGMTVRQYLEALMNFGLSCHKRPGSWEAQGFDPENYRGQDGGHADRWFE